VEIRRLHKRLSATSVFVTHDQVEAMTLADKLIVMNKGHVEQVGTPLEIYHRPRTRFVGTFIGSPAMNFFDTTIAAGGDHVLLDGIVQAIDPVLGGQNAGTAVSVGIRPEHCRLVPAGTVNSVPANVDFIEELGSGRIVHVEIDGLSFAVSVEEDQFFEQGAVAGLQLPSEHIHLFSQETGLRLDDAPAATRQPTPKTVAA
jgi:sn-glycerol 3-phosphate transport system ATP-binding protein